MTSSLRLLIEKIIASCFINIFKIGEIRLVAYVTSRTALYYLQIEHVMKTLLPYQNQSRFQGYVQ